MDAILPPLTLATDEARDELDHQVDVLVIGFGLAGASAAIEARRAGASVCIVDRFTGGGASARSGGVFIAGGGSRQQVAAGYQDDPEQMFQYLSLETKGCVSDDVLRAFCDRSLDDLAFLEDMGVPFPPSGHAPKTSYPEDDVTLYFSGNELCPPYSEKTPSVPRGHRALGHALTGDVIFRHVREATSGAGAEIRLNARVRRLVVDPDGRVIGAELCELPTEGPVAKKLQRLRERATRLGMFSERLYERAMRRIADLERDHGRTVRIGARGGVVLAAGGFVYNRELMRRFAAPYIKGMALGTAADDGSGLSLGRSVGAGLAQMDRVGAWRFINPPVPMVEGIMVDGEGARICNEELYGSAIGQKTVDDHDGRAWLVFDKSGRDRVLADVKRAKKLNFQYVTALVALFINRKRARTIEQLEEKCLIPHRRLERTITAYNERAHSGAPDLMGKSKEHTLPLEGGPWYAVDCTIGNAWFPLPCITLGGLTVEGLSGRVLDESGEPIEGLYAAGRTAAGICSNSYISGLSLADCVFSGRNCGRSTAARTHD